MSVKKMFKEPIYGKALPVQSARHRARACRHAHIQNRSRARTPVCRTASICAQPCFARTLVKTGSRSTTTSSRPPRRCRATGRLTQRPVQHYYYDLGLLSKLPPRLE